MKHEAYAYADLALIQYLLVSLYKVRLSKMNGIFLVRLLNAHA